MGAYGSTTGVDNTGTIRRSRPRVVIVGAGPAGLSAAKHLVDKPWRWTRVQVTLIDQHSHHAFTPFLYQVATAQLEPSGATRPVRALIGKLGNAKFRLATVTGINVTRHQVETNHGPVPYDYLILAAGSANDYAGNAELAQHSMGLDDLDGALALRNHILGCFEAANWADDPTERSRLLTFAVVGGGPTGVELAAALTDLARRMTKHDYSGIDASEVRIVLMEASEAPLGSFAPDLRDAARNELSANGVDMICNAEVTGVSENGITWANGRHLEAATVVWAAGVRASPLAETLPTTGSQARVIVDPALQVERHPDVFVVGDMAEIPGASGALPMRASVAIQSGRHAAGSILSLCAGRHASAFRYRARGEAAHTGRHIAVAQIGRRRLAGFPGWLAWLWLHIVRTVGPSATAAMFVRSLASRLRPRHTVYLTSRPTRNVHPGVVGPQPSTARGPADRGKVDLPSVNVSNANKWGRVAALAWWSQAYPGLEPPTEETHLLESLRQRVTKVRHELTGDKSQTTINRRG